MLKFLCLLLTLISFNLFSQTIKREKRIEIGTTFYSSSAFRRLKINSTETTIVSNLNLRNKLESARFSYDYGGFIRYNLTPILVLESGFLIANKGWKLDNLPIVNVKREPIGIAKNKVHLYTLEVPILLAYRFYTQNKISLFIATGIATGYIYQATNESITTINGIKKRVRYNINDVYSNFTFSSIVNIGLESEITEKLKMSISPTVHYTFNNVLFSRSLLEAPYSYGLKLNLFFKI